MNAHTYLLGLPNFLAYFGLSLGLMLAFALLYSRLTPHHEFALIKQNKPAAAIAFGGSLIGFVLPLYSAISQSVSLLDCAVWGAIALIVQLLTFFALRLFIRDLPDRIARDEIACGIFVACSSMAVGLLNAASMTY
jgi:putative membrane protein